MRRVPGEGHLGAQDSPWEACARERLGPREDEPRAKSRRAFDDEDTPQRRGRRKKERLLQSEMCGALRPSRYAQPPALSQVFSGGADPGIDQRIPERLGCGIEPSLLRILVDMIEIELVAELVEGHGETGILPPGNIGDF
jgi:hypothetical protein